MQSIATEKESKIMDDNASRNRNEIDETIANALSRCSNPIPFQDAKTLLGEILNVTKQPLLSKSEKESKIDSIIHNAIASLDLD